MRRLDPGLEPRERTPEPDPYVCPRCDVLVREEDEPHPCRPPSVYEVAEGHAVRWLRSEVTIDEVRDVCLRECEDLDDLEDLHALLVAAVAEVTHG